MLIQLLAALREARIGVEKLETAIKLAEKPHLEAAAQASAALRRALKPYAEAEEKANAEAKTVWLAANKARTAELLRGVEAPGIPVPAPWLVQERSTAEISDPDSVPREYCEPSKALVIAALKARTAVPGAELVINPVFVYRAPKDFDPADTPAKKGSSK